MVSGDRVKIRQVILKFFLGVEEVESWFERLLEGVPGEVEETIEIEAAVQ